MNLSRTSTYREVVTFFIVTYVVSWSLFFIGKQTNFLPIIMLGVWTPTLASIFLTRYFRGKNGVFLII